MAASVTKSLRQCYKILNDLDFLQHVAVIGVTASTFNSPQLLSQSSFEDAELPVREENHRGSRSITGLLAKFGFSSEAAVKICLKHLIDVNLEQLYCESKVGKIPLKTLDVRF